MKLKVFLFVLFAIYCVDLNVAENATKDADNTDSNIVRKPFFKYEKYILL